MNQRPSAQSVFLEPCFNETVLSRATGFFVRSARGVSLITNRHVVTGRHNETDLPLSEAAGLPNCLRARFHSWVRDQAGSVFTTEAEAVLALVDGESRPLWREHSVHGATVDVIAIDADPGPEWPPLLVPTDESRLPVAVSADVFVVGFPLCTSPQTNRLIATWVRASIASEPEHPLDGLPRFLVDARTRAGQSGSPVYAYSPGGATRMVDGAGAIETGFLDGPMQQLVGVYSGRTDVQSDLGYVWTLSCLQEVAVNGVRAEQSHYVDPPTSPDL